MVPQSIASILVACWPFFGFDESNRCYLEQSGVSMTVNETHVECQCVKCKNDPSNIKKSRYEIIVDLENYKIILPLRILQSISVDSDTKNKKSDKSIRKYKFVLADGFEIVGSFDSALWLIGTNDNKPFELQLNSLERLRIIDRPEKEKSSDFTLSKSRRAQLLLQRQPTKKTLAISDMRYAKNMQCLNQICEESPCPDDIITLHGDRIAWKDMEEMYAFHSSLSGRSIRIKPTNQNVQSVNTSNYCGVIAFSKMGNYYLKIIIPFDKPFNISY